MSSGVVYAQVPPPAPVPKPKSDAARRRGMIASVIVGSIVVHVVALILFGLWVVARQFAKPEAVFQVRETLKIPVPRMPEHRMNVAKHQAAAPKPVMPDRLVSTRPAKFALPELPKLDLAQMLPLDPSELVNDQVASLVGSAGLGAGGAGLSGGSGLGRAMANLSFLGLNAQGQRVLLLFDVSTSVVNKAEASGLPLTRIKDETLKLIDSLPAAAQFGLIQFVRNYKPFTEQLVPATPANRSLARQWIEDEWSESGQMARGQKGVLSPDPNGVVCVLEAAFAMSPDVIFLLSDGQFEQTYPKDRRIPNDEIEDLIKSLQKGRTGKTVLHFLGFQMRPEDKSAWEMIARRTGGRLKEIGVK